MITAKRLRELLDYDPASGVFRWRVNRQGHAKAGDRAGTISATKYRHIKIDGHVYMSARLAFLWMTGDWPKHVVDHADRNGLNDRWSNLREATISQNGANAKGSSATGFKGVTFDKSRNKYAARIKVNYRMINLGRFETAEEAHAVYADAARAMFGEFARVA